MIFILGGTKPFLSMSNRISLSWINFYAKGVWYPKAYVNRTISNGIKAEVAKL